MRQELRFHPWMIGVDEAGRGALAGPVVAAAVVLGPGAAGVAGIDDSKRLSAAKRRALARLLARQALCCAWGWSSAAEIDAVGIERATREAMRRALWRVLAALHALPEPVRRGIAQAGVWVDGPRGFEAPLPVYPVVKGDQRWQPIAAASILAKEARDHYMRMLDRRYPAYGFSDHLGYGTAAHRKALLRLGASLQHRRSFAPVACVQQILF